MHISTYYKHNYVMNLTPTYPIYYHSYFSHLKPYLCIYFTYLLPFTQLFFSNKGSKWLTMNCWWWQRWNFDIMVCKTSILFCSQLFCVLYLLNLVLFKIIICFNLVLFPIIMCFASLQMLLLIFIVCLTHVCFMLISIELFFIFIAIDYGV